MPEENAHKFLFAIVLLGLVFFIGRDASRVSGENSGREVQVTSLAQVMAAPFAEEAQTPPLAQVPPRATAVAAADAPTDAFLRTSAVAVPELHVRAALAADLQTGQELFALNPYQRWPIASLTKLMTAVVAKTEIGPEKPVLVSEAAIAADGPAGSFGTGEKYLARDLIRSIIAVSSNDAAEALAEHYGRKGFVAKMNEVAQGLGMIQTNFADPTGISSLDQSSPEDLRKLAAFLYEEHPDVLAAARSKETKIQELASGAVRTLTSINAFSGRPEFLGGKTGYTDEAGGNLVSIFSYLHRPVFIVVLGTEDRFGETEKLFEWLKKSYAR